MANSRKSFRSLIVLAVGTFLLGMSEFIMEGILPDLSHDLGNQYRRQDTEGIVATPPSASEYA